MTDVHHTMTGLEVRFEEEMSVLPGWRSEAEDLSERVQQQMAEPSPESERDHRVEEAMILGS